MIEEKTIGSYIEQLTGQNTAANITTTASTRVSIKTKLIIQKLAELTGEDEKKIAGELLDIAINDAYKKVGDKIQISEEEIRKEAEKIQASNKRKGKKKTTT